MSKNANIQITLKSPTSVFLIIEIYYPNNNMVILQIETKEPHKMIFYAFILFYKINTPRPYN